ncbi:hypothetical protein GFS31_06100 [Leptolyngbya sp. BL0902]|nr:hypothetical protein GFS31_06100 [Leptolyngbya sp. BL0902]
MGGRARVDLARSWTATKLIQGNSGKAFAKLFHAENQSLV